MALRFVCVDLPRKLIRPNTNQMMRTATSYLAQDRGGLTLFRQSVIGTAQSTIFAHLLLFQFLGLLYSGVHQRRLYQLLCDAEFHALSAQGEGRRAAAAAAAAAAAQGEGSGGGAGAGERSSVGVAAAAAAAGAGNGAGRWPPGAGRWCWRDGADAPRAGWALVLELAWYPGRAAGAGAGCRWAVGAGAGVVAYPGWLALLVEAGALRPRVRGVVVDLRTPAAARTAAHEIVCAYACVRVCAVLHGRVAVRVCATFCAGRRGDGALWP